MNREECIAWADRHHFHLTPIHVARNGFCTCGRDECKGKHRKYKVGTPWNLKNERYFALDCELSHIIVLDIDPRSGGFQSLEELMELVGKLSPELIIRTGGGGYHYYYADWYRPHRYKSGSLMPGIDIKAGHHSIVVAPWMPHHSGSYYELIQDGVPQDPPEKLEEMLERMGKPKEKHNQPLTNVTGKTLFDLLDMSKFSKVSDGWRGPHPCHDSASGNNFMISPDGVFWRCWRHGSYGGRTRLMQMLNGEHCEAFV